MSVRKIRLSEELTLPIDAVTNTFGIIAKRRAGKSYFARRFTEQIVHAGQQVVIIDPKGDWWGIRSAADGKGPGLPIVILGGDRGDVPIEAGSGELVAKLAVEERVSMLLDLSLLRKHEVATFMAAFLETLYRLKNHERYRTPMMLVIDEADAIAPQRTSARGGQGGNAERMLGAANDIVRRGGQRGIGCTLVTQRSAVLSKDVLTQCEVLIALRTIAPQDLAALMAWVEVHGTLEGRATLKESLPSLPIGDAWVWSPGWPTDKGIFEHVHVLPIETFDSGATPKPGERRVEPKTLADVDLTALRSRMAETIERAKADDPKALRAEIVQLKKELAKKVPAPEVQRVEVPVVSQEARSRIDSAILDMSDAADRMQAAVTHCHQALEAMSATMNHARNAAVLMSPRPKLKPALSRAPRVNGAAKNGEGVKLTPGQRETLTCCAQHDGGCTRTQIKIITGYAVSTRNRFISELSGLGLLVAEGDRLVVTAEGDALLEVLGFEPLPTGDALREHWLNELPEGNAKILRLICKGYPDPVDRDALDEQAGYATSTRNRLIYELQARKLVEPVGRGQVRASAELFS